MFKNQHETTRCLPLNVLNSDSYEVYFCATLREEILSNLIKILCIFLHDAQLGFSHKIELNQYVHCEKYEWSAKHHESCFLLKGISKRTGNLVFTREDLALNLNKMLRVMNILLC